MTQEETLGFNTLSLEYLKIAPIPKATLAILWVASAELKGNPKRMIAGNWIRPAPPPESAERKLEIKEIRNNTN